MMRAQDVQYIEEPPWAKALFGSVKLAWVWLILRLWVGWEWLQAGWGKVFGGNITWKFWDWGSEEYALTGAANVGWIVGGTRTLTDGTVVQVGIGDNVASFAARAIEASEGPHPDVAFSWYVSFLEWVENTAHVFLGPLVAIGELAIGILLIIGLFTGIAAFLGATLNFSFVFAGSAGVNPLMILVSGLLILAWRVAGWYGLDRYVLPKLGVPWQPGDLFQRETTPAR